MVLYVEIGEILNFFMTATLKDLTLKAACDWVINLIPRIVSGVWLVCACVLAKLPTHTGGGDKAYSNKSTSVVRGVSHGEHSAEQFSFKWWEPLLAVSGSILYNISMMDCMLKCLCCIYVYSSGLCRICLRWPTINIEPTLHTHTHIQQRVSLKKGFGPQGDVLLTALYNTLSSPYTHPELTGHLKCSVSRWAEFGSRWFASWTVSIRQTILAITSRLSQNFWYRFSSSHLPKVPDQLQNIQFLRGSCQCRFTTMSAIAGNGHYSPMIGGINQSPISGPG